MEWANCGKAGLTWTQITSHLDRLQTVEKELATLKANNALKEDVTKVRGEMKKVYVSHPIRHEIGYSMY